MCVELDDGERPEFSADVWQTARKSHKCCECRRTIEPGERYCSTRGVWDGNFHVYKTCAHCVVLRNWLGEECGAWCYTEVVSDVREHVADYGVSSYGFGLARLVVLAGKDWRRRGNLVQVPTKPATTHERMRTKPEPPQ